MDIGDRAACACCGSCRRMTRGGSSIPTLAESQLEGGIIQGIGYALFEERVLDGRLGIPLNPTMHDYKMPTIGDVPRDRCVLRRHGGRRGEPHGREGVGGAADHWGGGGDRECGGGCDWGRGHGDSVDAVASVDGVGSQTLS